MNSPYAKAGYYLVSPMFTGVSTAGMNIQDLKPSSKTEIEDDQIVLIIINPERKTVGTYTYRPEGWDIFLKEPIPAGWYEGDDLAVKTFKEGEGFMLKCEYAIDVTFSGQVITAEPSYQVAAKGYYRAGNMTPAAVDIQTIVPSSATEFEDDQIVIFTYNSDRVVTKTYTYRPEGWDIFLKEPIPAGWYEGDDLAVKTFQPGEGFVLKTEYADLKLTFPNPVK